MAVRRKRIYQLVTDMLKTNKLEKPPVPVQRLARVHGLTVVKDRKADTTISGFLVRRGSATFIGVNAFHPLVRQRFTIAHELGHFLLHAPGPSEVHIDRVFDVKFRNEVSAQGIDLDEREANFFAASLLMPEQFIAKDLAEVDQMDLVNEAYLEKLAGRYQVSTQALVFRLANLRYLSL